MRENIKRFIKSCIPWRLRYFIKLQEAKGNIRFPDIIKQKSLIKEYNDELYDAMKKLGINDFNEKTVCEMGPGQYLSHAFMEYQMGAEKEFLLEIADFANVNAPADNGSLIMDNGYGITRTLPAMTDGETWKTYLEKINAVYRTDGLGGYKQVPDSSVDYLFSFSVFEHIRKNIFMDTMKEAYRFMCSGGISYHTVDFKDHLGGGKNQLRFPENVWEDKDHYKMDNYTNRLACSEICQLMIKAGFRIVRVEKKLFKKEPLKRKCLDDGFADISDDDMRTAGAVIIARKD